MESSQLKPQPTGRENASAKASRSAKEQWLSWLHEMLPDVSSLLLFEVNPNKSVSLCAQNPATASTTESINNAVLSSVHRQSALYVPEAAKTHSHILSIPFIASKKKGEKDYVLVMLSTGLTTIQQNTALKLSLWAASQLQENEANATLSATGKTIPPVAQLSLALVAAQQQHGTFNAMAFALVNTLANLCGCVRVSLGYHDGTKLRLAAMSGQSKVDDKRQIARQLCALMLDVLEREQVIYPVSENTADPSVQAYYKSQGKYPLLSFVMPSSGAEKSNAKINEKFVLVLERSQGNQFIAAQADAIQTSVSGLASLLELSRSAEVPLKQKLKRLVRRQVEQVQLVRDWSAKRWFATVAAILLLASFVIPVSHRVSANAFIEASDRQVLVAAQDGFILSAHARAGEEVAKGDLLAKINGEDLQLGLDKWASEKAKNQQEYAQALAIHDRSELSRLRADEKRIDAEIALFEQQIRRSEVRAPFDGVLLDGDWTQSLGAPVKTGDVLFEVASAEKYRLILQVDEHDVGYIKPEQVADLRMAALPTSVWRAELGDLMPVAVSEKGSSAFRVPATISGEATALRPGMEGVGKVTIGNRSMFWVYTHKLGDKLRYAGWKIGLL